MELVGSGRAGKCQPTNHAADAPGWVVRVEKSSAARLTPVGEDISSVAL